MRQALKGLSARAVLLAAVAAAGGAQAHQTNPQCYVDGVQIRPLGRFAFTSKQAADFHAELLRRPPGSCPASAGGVSAKSCGQVDHWHVVTIMSSEYCAKMQGAARASGARAVAEVAAPPSYLSRDHHLLYTYKNANPAAVVLQGMCVICETVEAAPK